MSYTLKGKVTAHGGVREFKVKNDDAASTEIVVEETGVEYPQRGVFELMKVGEYIKYVTQAEADFPVGSLVEVEFNLSTNSTKDGRFFPKLRIWKITKLQGADNNQQQVQGVDDDLPY